MVFSNFGAVVTPKRSLMPALLGAGAGFFVGGPIGAAVGGAAGYFFGVPRGVPVKRISSKEAPHPPPLPIIEATVPLPRPDIIAESIARLENMPVIVDQGWGVESGGGVGSGGSRLQIQGYDALTNFVLATARAKTRRRGGH